LTPPLRAAPSNSSFFLTLTKSSILTSITSV
jgi:hypothetical protein